MSCRYHIDTATSHHEFSGGLQIYELIILSDRPHICAYLWSELSCSLKGQRARW